LNKDSKEQSEDSSVANTSIPTPLEGKNFNRKGRNSLHENNFRHNSMSRTLHVNAPGDPKMSNRKRSVFQNRMKYSALTPSGPITASTPFQGKNSATTRNSQVKQSENFFRASSIGKIYKFENQAAKKQHDFRMRKLNIDSGKDFAESPIESGDIANINSNSGSLGMAIIDQ
jgi:hypothetical protein